MLVLTCATCSDVFTVPKWRTSAKYCSARCRDDAAIKPANTICGTCGKPFRLKPYSLQSRALGTYCSRPCSAVAKQVAYSGSSNPNYKGRNVDSDGYRVFPAYAQRIFGVQHSKMHQAVACSALGLRMVPSGLHVHHRDCDVRNNTPENLAVLSVSDHKWLHKQFGIAPLWAFMRGKVELDVLSTWSDDILRARKLLQMNVCAKGDQLAYISENIDLFKA